MEIEAFMALQSKIGCNNKVLAGWLGVTPNTVARWRTGLHRIPHWTQERMDRLATGWRP